jgi:hypothetical protein
MKISLLDPIDEPTGAEQAVVVAGDGEAKRVNLLTWATNQLASVKAGAIAAVAAAQVAATDAITALIGQASNYALSAADARDAAVAAAAGVPVGAAFLSFAGPPPTNAGQTGDVAYNSADKLWYTRTGAGWSTGVPVLGDLVTRDSVVYDLRRDGGTFPSAEITTTRAQQTTNLLHIDAMGTVYQTFAANVPARHPVIGLLDYQRTNCLISMVNPGDGARTVNMPVAGILIIWANDANPGAQVTTSAGDVGPATATNFGTTVCGAGNYQALNVTAPGNVKVTVANSSAAMALQVEYNSDIPARSIPTPFKGSAGIRDADQLPLASTILGILQGAAGTMLFDVRVPVPVAATSSTILGFNGLASLFLSNATSLTYYDQTHINSAGLGSVSSSTGLARVGITYDAARTSWGGGSRIPGSIPYPLNNGVARANARIGAPTNGANLQGQQALNGGIPRIEYLGSALDDLTFFNRYNIAQPIPKLSKFLRNFDSVQTLKAYRQALLMMRAGVPMPSGTWPVILFGPGTSHQAGTNPVSTTKVSSVAARWAARMAASGTPATIDNWFGATGLVTAGGVNTYDNRISNSAGFSAWGTQLVHSAMRAATAGCTHNFTPSNNTDSYRIFCWTGQAAAFGGAYGRLAASVNGGPTLKTFDCNIAAGLSYFDIGPGDGVPLGMNNYQITTLDAKPVGIAGAIAWNSTSPHLIVVNGGTSLRTAVTMATDNISASSPENSVPEIARKLQPSLALPDFVTNDASGLTAPSTYTSCATSILSALVAIGCDVLMMSDPPTAIGTIPQATQNKYTDLALAIALKLGLSVIDVHYALGAQAPYAATAMGIYSTDGTHLNGTIAANQGSVTGYDIIAYLLWQLLNANAVIGI